MEIQNKQLRLALCLLIAFVIIVIICMRYDPKIIVVSNAELDCGTNCLYDALSLLDINCPAADIARALHTSGKPGSSFADIEEVANRLGAITNGVRLSASQLMQQKCPCIAFVNGNHFITIAAIDAKRNRLFVLDRPHKPEWFSTGVFDKKWAWNGELLLLSRAEKIGARAWVQDNRIDLGEFLGVQSETVDRTIINIGEVPLTIRNIRMSCSCATATMEPSIIAAHGSGLITFRIDSSQKDQGHFELTMLLESEGSSRSVSPIKLAGSVRHPFRAEPGFISLGDILPDERSCDISTHLIFNSSVVLKPRFLGNGITWQESWKTGEGEYEVRCKLDPAKAKLDPDGRFRTSIIIGTDRADYPGLKIPIVGRVLKSVAVMPGSIFLGQVRANEPTIRRVYLSGANVSRDLKIFKDMGGGRLEQLQLSQDEMATAEPLSSYHFSSPWLSVVVSAPKTAGIFSQTYLIKSGPDECSLVVVGEVK